MNTSRDASESGIGVFDLRHINHSLLGLVNKVIVACEESDLSVAKAVLPDLLDAATAQFEYEERAMNDTMYATTVQHHLDHQRLLAEIQRQVDGLEAGRADALSGLRVFQIHFLQLFLQHIASQDMLFTMSLVPGIGAATQALDQDDNVRAEVPLDDQFGIQEPILWSARHSIDIQPIDEDHKAIFSLLREIIESSPSTDNTSLAILLERLGDETVAHFRSEELVMAQHNYEFAAAHEEEHRNLLDEYAHQVEEFRNDSISAELMCRFVYRWFVRHIEVSDIPLSNAIRRQSSSYVS